MSATPALDLSLSTAPQLYELLRQEVLRGELSPGDRLSETEVAKRFGVSRQPVREAFIRLTADGLAEVRPQRGTFIRKISVSAVLSARMIRESVEGDLVRMVTDAPDVSLVARLDEELRQQELTVPENDSERFVALDDRFHYMIAEAAGHEGVWLVLEGLRSQMNRLRHITAKKFDLQKLIGQHREIVEALRAGDADLAEQAMRGHLNQLLDDLPEVTSAHPDLFTT